MVVSGHPLASAVGRDILRAGGNAVDAAVAVGFALAVVHPEAGNIGGGGFMVIRTADGTVRSLDYRETAPGGASRDMYLDASGEPTEKSVTGHLAAGVPGSAAGLVEAHAKMGRLPFDSVIGPAIRLARDGFVIDEYRSESIRSDSTRLSSFPASLASYLPDGKPPVPGTTLRQPDLATTLDAIRTQGAAGFYQGAVADLIVAEMARGGGLITLADLAAYRAIWRDPDHDRLPRPHDLQHAAGLVGRRHHGRDSQHHGGILPAAAVRHAGAAPPRSGGDAARLHRSQHAPG